MRRRPPVRPRSNRAGRLRVDPRLAAELEVAWWHAHRAQQHDDQVTYDDLVTAMVRFYCYVYQADPADVRRAAERRVQAMALSDAWVAAGCHLDDPTLAEERLTLVASYTALRDDGCMNHPGLRPAKEAHR